MSRRSGVLAPLYVDVGVTVEMPARLVGIMKDEPPSASRRRIAVVGTLPFVCCDYGLEG